MINLFMGALSGVHSARFATSCSVSSSDHRTRDRFRLVVDEEVGESAVAVENVGITSEIEGVGSRPPVNAPPV